MKRRVLIFSLAYHPFLGGAEVAIREITDRLDPRRFSFEIVTLRFDRALPARERIGNVVVHRVGRGGRATNAAATYGIRFFSAKALFIPRAALLARRLHRERPFDVLWAMMSYMLLPLLLARLLGVRAPYLLTLQEGDSFRRVFGRLRVLPLLPFLLYGFRRAGAVQCISSHLAGWARSLGARRIVVIPNGADLARFRMARPRRDEVRRGLGFSPDALVLTTVSRLVRKNAVGDVIRALPLLPSRATLLVVGDGPELPKLQKLAERLAAGRVRFLGAVPHAEVPALLAAADVFVRPSLSEGMGNAFIEAMAAGVPVVGTRVGGIADFLFDPTENPDRRPTGRSVPPRNPEAIAAAVSALADSPGETAVIAENARRLVEERYSWDRIAPAVRDLLVRLSP